MRFYLELAVVVGLAVFAYDRIAPRWNGFFSPLKPAERTLPPPEREAAEKRANALVPLSQPAAPAAVKPAPGRSMLVVPPDASAAPVFERPPIPEGSPALAQDAPTYDAQVQPRWFIRLKAVDWKFAGAAVLALAAGLWLGVSKALTRR